jgi:hypothetical protein
MDVEELPGQDGPFAVRLTIVQFEKRMKVSGEIAFEFIARGTSPCIGLLVLQGHGSFSFPFAVREDMETEVLCDEKRYNETTWSVGGHDTDDGTKPSHPPGCSHRHKGTGERTTEPAARSPSQQGSRVVLNLVLVVVTETPTRRSSSGLRRVWS